MHAVRGTNDPAPPWRPNPGSAGAAWGGWIALVSELPLPSTTDLLVACGARDRASFARLYAEIGPRVKGYVARISRDPAVAEELTQDILLTVWRRADRYDPARASAETWIFAIARNRVIDTIRRRKLPAPDETDPTWVPAAPVNGDQIVADRQRSDRIRDALLTLPDAQRDVMHQAFFESRSYPEIAEDQGVALGTVKSRARLAFERLRELLAREDA